MHNNDTDTAPKKGDVVAGSKRKAEISSPKQTRKAVKQRTIEETFSNDNVAGPPTTPTKGAGIGDTAIENTDEKSDNEEAGAGIEISEKAEDIEANEKIDTFNSNSIKSTGSKDNNAVQESSQREKKIASNILEKGIVYFFARNRVGVDDSESVGDLQRTYFVLRPLPLGTKLGEPNT